jgi:hypothetical protein
MFVLRENNLFSFVTTLLHFKPIFNHFHAYEIKFKHNNNFICVLGLKNLPVTRIVDELMELRGSQYTEDFRHLDPKQLRPGDAAQPRSRAPFQEAIVFVVGGGNYIEYQNLVDYTRVGVCTPDVY